MSIQTQEASTQYIFDIKIDLTLINHLRSFQQKDHKFLEGYLETIYLLLSQQQGTAECELFSQFSTSKGSTLEALIFAVHYYFASIYNLSPLLKALGLPEDQIIQLSKSEVNKTNILCIHTIIDRKGQINHVQFAEKAKTVKPNYLKGISVRIANDAKESFEDGLLTLDFDKINLSILAKGKLDPYVTNYIAHIVNKKFNLELTHILLAFFDQKAVATENYSERFQVIIKGCKDFKFDREVYHSFRNKLVEFTTYTDYNQQKIEEVWRLLNDIDAEVGKSIIARVWINNHYLEKLLIGMLGHPLQIIRDQAIILLNVLHDGVDWQKRTPYKPRISRVGSKFLLEYLFELEEGTHPGSIVLLLKTFILDPQCKDNITSWHRPKLKEYRSDGSKKYVVFQMDFGKFIRCGFYDWKLVRLTKSGKLQSVAKIMNMDDIEEEVQLQVSNPIQGRFIVQPSGAADLQIHEIYPDLLDAKPDAQGKFTKRGNFRKVKDKLPELLRSGINCVYLMGALERDNGFFSDPQTNMKTFKRPDVSPLAITDRQTPNSMLGGEQAFSDLMAKAKEIGIKIVIDSLTRISSARPHKKYKKYFVYRLDEHNKQVTLYGTDGRSYHFEDTILLNYRKKRVWEVLLDEIVAFKDKYGVNGIHLDNGHAWPQIFALDQDEMYRQESDGSRAYTNKQIFDGEVVLQSEDCGFWGSSVKDSYPNPFFIKLCKHLWARDPNFLIIGDAWGAMGGLEDREVTMICSGIIPRLFKLPIALAQIFGENLKKDGTMVSMERKNVNAIKKWVEENKKAYPTGSVVIQSTTYHAWPYPALIYKRGTWAAVDLFFLLNDIPMTFMGEQEGHAFREKTTNVYQLMRQQATTEIVLNDPTKQKQEKKVERKLKRRDSYLQQQQSSQTDLGFGYNTHLFIQQTAATAAISALQRENSSSGSTEKISPVKVQSGQSLSQMEMWKIEGAQEEFRRQVGPERGFDLSQIGKHYEHRRQLRNKYKVLRTGKMISLSAEHMYGWHTHVLAFARYKKHQMALIAINFNDGDVDLFLNMKNLRYYFPNSENSDVVVKLRNWSTPQYEVEDENLYFIGELIEEHLEYHLKSYQTQIWGVEIYENNADLQSKAKSHSLNRLLKKLNSQIPSVIYSNDVGNMLIDLTKKSKTLQEFMNGFSYFFNRFIDPFKIELNQLISQMKNFQIKKDHLCELFAFFYSICDLKTIDQKTVDQLKYYSTIESILEKNTLGSIAFMTPELGKWTTTGGLGVMVDELTQEMAKMNEDVIVVTPYYELNKRGESGYMKKDGFEYKFNIDIWMMGQKIQIGVHEGVVNGVKLYFLHNIEYFHHAYAGEDANYIIRQLSVYAKAALELFCQLKIFPSTIVTNDWFCAMVPAYIKCKKFGDVFNNTKCFHIAHNLDPLYEGRVYPKPDEGVIQEKIFNLFFQTLDYIHELPNDLFIDPFWTTFVLNPSRCAFLSCDNWGTVSNSYKYELLEQSPLANILRKFPQPFAFPNGIRRQQRFQNIMNVTNNDHLEAKKKLQKKYFNSDDTSIPVFGFVGRITKQKGVHLILDVVEELVHNLGGRIQILVGGQADFKEEYSAQCAHRMQSLKHRFPYNFWADPSLFFTDGTVVNVGCDFGLMPSMFEPGGIVQHEFFIGSTPVVAFKTGGLRDTVHEYDQKNMKGSGFIFEQYDRYNFIQAIYRAIGIFSNDQHYQQLRKNSFEAAIDVADVGRAWTQEFYRLSRKNFIDKEWVQNARKRINMAFSLDQYKEESNQFKKTEGRVYGRQDDQKKAFERILIAAKRQNLRLHVFFYRTSKFPQPRQVSLSGTFDDWKIKHKLKLDPFSKVWSITLQLRPGEYYYKFLVDDQWVCSEEDNKDNDIYGNINNYIVVE